MTKKKWLLIPLVLVLILVSFYCYQAIQFQNKFLDKTMIGNTDVSKLTKEEAKGKLNELVDAEVYRVLNNGDVWKEIPKKELGMEYDIDKTLDNAMAHQNPWLWFMSYIKAPEKETLEAKGINKDSLNKIIVSVNKDLETFNKSLKKTTNASVEQKDGKFQIIPEVQGNSIDTKKFISATTSSIEKGEAEIELTEFIEKPTILATDDNLKKELENINKIADINASYSINGQEVKIPKEKMASWVVFKDGKLDLKQNEVKKYVEELGSTYNTSTNASKFKSTKRGDVSVPAGALSWTIATDTETEQLTEAILKGEDFSGRIPAFQGSGTPSSELIGNTYIEVDLQNQHMWYYKDGKEALETAVITGKPSTPTPAGVFYVWNKKRNEILRGEDYASPVDYWMPIDWTGVGIHDSPWQSGGAYGGNSFQTVGSHGCINTPPAVASKLFNMIEVGVPVIIF